MQRVNHHGNLDMARKIVKQALISDARYGIRDAWSVFKLNEFTKAKLPARGTLPQPVENVRGRELPACEPTCWQPVATRTIQTGGRITSVS